MTAVLKYIIPFVCTTSILLYVVFFAWRDDPLTRSRKRYWGRQCMHGNHPDYCNECASEWRKQIERGDYRRF